MFELELIEVVVVEVEVWLSFVGKVVAARRNVIKRARTAERSRDGPERMEMLPA